MPDAHRASSRRLNGLSGSVLFCLRLVGRCVWLASIDLRLYSEGQVRHPTVAHSRLRAMLAAVTRNGAARDFRSPVTGISRNCGMGRR